MIAARERMVGTRTDMILRAVLAEIETQRASLDAGSPLSSLSVIVHLHPDGNLRRVQVRLDAQHDVAGNGHRRLEG